MPSLNFKKQFAELVRSGKKCQTIRAPRKRPIEVGDTLHLFTGQRTSYCEKLAIVKCVSVEKIELYVKADPYERHVIVQGCLYPDELKERLAIADGFASFSQFFGFFFDNDPAKELRGFHGDLIKWEPFGGECHGRLA